MDGEGELGALMGGQTDVVFVDCVMLKCEGTCLVCWCCICCGGICVLVRGCLRMLGALY